MSKKLDLRGQKFGRLTVIEEAGRAKNRHVLWRCRCKCGNETVVSSSDLRSGNTTSCGCYNREHNSELQTKHGLCKHAMYGVWCNMMVRTGVYKGAEHRDYIDRGISVCDEWKAFQNFYDWSIAHGYSKGLQIDRIDNDRGYEPDNCRWVTPKMNTNNRRCTIRLSDGTPLAMFVSSFGIETTDITRSSTNEYNRIRYSFRAHGEHSAITLVFDLALEQFADKLGFTYCKNAIVHI